MPKSKKKKTARGIQQQVRHGRDYQIRRGQRAKAESTGEINLTDYLRVARSMLFVVNQSLTDAEDYRAAITFVSIHLIGSLLSPKAKPLPERITASLPPNDSVKKLFKLAAARGVTGI